MPATTPDRQRPGAPHQKQRQQSHRRGNRGRQQRRRCEPIGEGRVANVPAARSQRVRERGDDARDVTRRDMSGECCRLPGIESSIMASAAGTPPTDQAFKRVLAAAYDFVGPAASFLTSAAVARASSVSGTTCVAMPSCVLDQIPRNIPLYAVWTPARRLSSKVRSFVDLLAEHIRPVPPWERGLSQVNGRESAPP